MVYKETLRREKKKKELLEIKNLIAKMKSSIEELEEKE